MNAHSPEEPPSATPPCPAPPDPEAAAPSLVESGWLPPAHTRRPAASRWTGRLEFKAVGESWFWPTAVITVDVRADSVHLWSDACHQGSVPRHELRAWFARGSADLPAGAAAWRPRPMGVAISVDGSPAYPMPPAVATHLASHL